MTLEKIRLCNIRTGFSWTSSSAYDKAIDRCLE